MKNIVLLGFMGTGKTSVGKILAAKLGREAVDVDFRIESDEKKKISEIFEEKGEAYFRAVEKKTIQAIARGQGLVITTGGGVVLDPENIETLRKNGILVTLSASPETIARRVKGSKRRPLLSGGDPLPEIKRLLELRKPLYEKADHHFNTDDRTPAQVADMILKKLEKETTQ